MFSSSTKGFSPWLKGLSFALLSQDLSLMPQKLQCVYTKWTSEHNFVLINFKNLPIYTVHSITFSFILKFSSIKFPIITSIHNLPVQGITKWFLNFRHRALEIHIHVLLVNITCLHWLTSNIHETTKITFNAHESLCFVFSFQESFLSIIY